MTNFADVPTGWKVVRLGDHVAYLKTISLSRAQLDEGSPVRYLHYGDIHTRASVKLPAGEEPMPRAPGDLIGNAGILEEGDLVFADASEDPDGVGKSVEITSTPDAGLVAGTHTIAARFDKCVLADGFKGYLQFIPAFRDALLRLAAGTKVLATTRSYISSVELALPPVEEQRAIARALGDVDDLVEALQRAIRKKQDVRIGLAQQLLTGRMRLPSFTGDWPVMRLGDHVTYVKTISLSRAQLDQDSPVRYLHYGDIHTRDSVKLPAGEEFMPRAPGDLIGSAGMLEKGDLVFADASEDPDGVGKSVEITSVPPEGVIAGSHTIAARFDKDVLADGFKGYLQFIPAFRDALLRLAAGTKVLATTRSYISSVELALPLAEEQRAIAEVLGDADAEIEALQRRLDKTLLIREGMMQELLTGRTRLPDAEVAA